MLGDRAKRWAVSRAGGIGPCENQTQGTKQMSRIATVLPTGLPEETRRCHVALSGRDAAAACDHRQPLRVDLVLLSLSAENRRVEKEHARGRGLAVRWWALP